MSMTSLDDLAQRLEAAGLDGWEDAYACTAFELAHDQVHELVTSGRPWSYWLAFRFDAGPPGVPLPGHEQALAAVLHGKDGTPLDAYRVVFAPHPMPHDAPPELILVVIMHSAACALKGGTTWFATWSAARAGLAALAFGQPDRAWHILDSLTIKGQRHPHLDVLAMFEPLRGNAALERDPHVRAAIGWLWPRLGLPVVPRLPLLPEPSPDGGALAATLDELRRIGADRVHDLVMTHVEAADRAVLDEHADHPLVRELQARAMVPGMDAPDCGELPPWFAAWARAVVRTGQPHLARLAGLVLHRAGRADGRFVAVLIMQAARAADLPLLAAGFDQPGMQPMLDELMVAARELPMEVADALVAAAWPHHVDADRALTVLTRHVDALERLKARTGGTVEYFARTVRSMVEGRTRDLAEAGPAHERLHAAVRHAASRLNNLGLLGVPDVERAAATIAVPEVTAGLVDRAAETSAALAPLEQLLFALALRRALAGTEHEAYWRPVFATVASDAVFTLGVPTLFGLRLQLLDEILAAPHRSLPLGELYFERANTRQVLSRSNGAEIALALADFRASMHWSRIEGDASRCAVATAAWVRLVAWQDASGDANPSALDEGGRLLDEAFALDLEPYDQALLHQARAHLLRRRHPQDALLAHEQALAVVPPEEPHAMELAAELVVALVRAHRVGEAVDRGLAFLEIASCRTKVTNLGMLHLSVGQALLAIGRFSEARRQLEAGLPLIRGRELHNEDLAHLHLARLGLITGDLALTEEHLRLLKDRADALDESTRCDLHVLEAAAASDSGRVEAQRIALRDAIELAGHDPLRTRLRLELARVDLVSGCQVAELDELFEHALGLASDADLDAVLIDIVGNLDVPLSVATSQAALRWAEHRARPDLAARVHYRAGRADDARSVLRTALAAGLPGGERLACVHQLVTMLDPHNFDERRRLCDELEELLDAHDRPHARLDLAAALLGDASDDPRMLRRARRHVQRGLEGVRDQQSIDFGHRLLRRIDRALDHADLGGDREDAAPTAPDPHGDDVLRFLAHPAGEAFMRVRTLHMPSAASDVDVPGLVARFELAVPAATNAPAARDPVCLDKLEALEDTMHSQATDRTRPGVLAAAVALVAHLARAGRRSIEDVRAATTAACDALPAVADLGVRSILLREIALVWSRDRRIEDPVRDLTLAIDLLRRCMELEGGEEGAAGDTMALLARALRDSAGGRRDNLREAKRLYELRFRRAQSAVDPDAIAATLCDLAEVEIEQGTGERREHLRRGERRLRDAATAARAPRLQARVAAELARVQTLIAVLLDGTERLRSMEAAVAAFGEVTFALLDEHDRRAAEFHRTLCEASLARLRGDRDGEIERWRHHLDSLDATTPAHAVAAAKHQLALPLMSGKGATAEQLAEGLRLAGEAAAVRTVERDPQGCTETALGVGRALVAALRTNASLLGALADRASDEARSWFEQAIAAAHALGPGEALADAALGVCELELATATDNTVVDRLERAWAVVTEATPYLVLHLESREREARTAMRIAAGLAHRLAPHATPTAVADIVYVLNGEDAEVVARWLLRAQEPARRPLRARLARPAAVSARLWEEWVSALAVRDGHRIVEALDRVRTAEPRFPDDSVADEPTWRWLLAHPDSAAISLILTEPAALAVIIQIDPSGLRRTWVLGLDLPPPPLACEALAALVSNKVPGPEAGRAIESLACWLRQHLVAPLERFLDRAPTAVLWCPDPRLRLIAPGAIWSGLPVAMTASLALPNLGASPARRRSTFIALADPGDQAPEPGLDLQGHGLPALESLARVAAERGAVRLLGSVGHSFGRTLLGDRTIVRNTPASVANLLAEAGEHDMIVILAHGRVDAIEDAALLCLDEDGDLDRLDVTTLARDPDRFAGATVLLLSCETGRASDSLAEPGGVAGTLVSAGARHVIAPLWPVQLDVAVQVGQAVLRGIQRGAAPWEILAGLRIDGADDAPTLGGPPPPLAMQRAERQLQGLAFVTWVG
jgi:hypothetical protein